MKTQWPCLVVAIIATGFGLLGSPRWAAAQCPPPCPPLGCGCAGKLATNVVNLNKAQQSLCKLAIDATGTSTVGIKGQTLVKIEVTATDANNKPTTGTATVMANGDWSIAGLTVPAGTYSVTAKMTTTDACKNLYTTDAKQPLKNIVVK